MKFDTTTTLALAAFGSLALAQSTSTTASPSATSSDPAAAPTEVLDCHLHGSTPFCFDAAGSEWEVEGVPAAELEERYGGCFAVDNDGDEIRCSDPVDVTLTSAAAEEGGDEHAEDEYEHSSGDEHEHPDEGPTEVSSCHLHGSIHFCFDAENAEWEVQDVTEAELAEAYTDCHLHGAEELHCSEPSDVALIAATATATATEEHAEEENSARATPSESTSAAAETQTTGNAASAMQISIALTMAAGAVVALCIF